MRIEQPMCNFQNCKYQQDENCVSTKEYNRCEFDQYRHLYGVATAEREKELIETAQIKEENEALKKALRVEVKTVEQQTKRISELVDEINGLKKENEVLSATSKIGAYTTRRIEAELNKAKQDVAREIIDEMFKMFENNFVNTPIYRVAPSKLKAELKKKYIGE